MAATDKPITADAQAPAIAGPRTNNVTIVELDKRYTRKQIKKLRDGRGKLMNDLADVISEMVTHDALPPSAHPVVLVVREKNDDAWDPFS